MAGLPVLVPDGSDGPVHGPDGGLAEHDSAGTSWVLTDALGSVRAVTDSTGAITDTDD